MTGNRRLDAGGPELVLVYGTLMAGECNHHWLAGAPLLERMALAGLVLHDLGPYPMAVRAAEMSTGPADAELEAELYGLSWSLLLELDRLEDHPREYQREAWPLADGRKAWIYLGRAHQVRGRPRIASGRWRQRG
jgi:gamma-glutamylcyclotransferase (GGCT)/AIG2-like uncharacterized protein YtfP